VKDAAVATGDAAKGAATAVKDAAVATGEAAKAAVEKK